MMENKFTKVVDKADSLGASQAVHNRTTKTVGSEKINGLKSNRVNTAVGLTRHTATAESRSAGWDERLLLGASYSDQVAESFRVLRSRILHPPENGPVYKTVMVTSVLPREGKSFVSANLAIALAQGVDHYALLVDCDLRLPSLAGLFGVPGDLGLADYLQNKRDISALIQNTSVKKLSILASGAPPTNPAELLGSLRMQNLVAELSLRYPDRVIVFDTPPFQVASEAAVLSKLVDGVVLVVRHGVSERLLIQKTVEEIGRNKIIGLIFNGHKNNVVSSKLLYKSENNYGDYYGTVKTRER